MPTPVDQDLLVRLRAALRDPTQRDIIQREIENAGPGGPGTLEGGLTRLGSAMQGARTSGGAAAAGIGGALGLGLRALMKKKRSMDPMTNRSSDNPMSAIDVPTAEPNLDRPAGTDSTLVPAAEAWKHGSGTADIGPNAAPATPAPPVSTDVTASPAVSSPGGRLMMGADARGNPLTSYDGGQTWKNDTTGAVVTGPIYNQSDIGGMKRGGRVRRFADGGKAADDALPPPHEPGRGVLMRHPMPVLHTTIVITPHHQPPDEKKPAKKKPMKKAKGGPIKPAAVPPKRGPEPQGPPAPFKKGGHVQVPRGSGCAKRGKSFRGIY